jgi:hypothetical protein
LLATGAPFLTIRLRWLQTSVLMAMARPIPPALLFKWTTPQMHFLLYSRLVDRLINGPANREVNTQGTYLATLEAKTARTLGAANAMGA